MGSSATEEKLSEEKPETTEVQPSEEETVTAEPEVTETDTFTLGEESKTTEEAPIEMITPEAHPEVESIPQESVEVEKFDLGPVVEAEEPEALVGTEEKREKQILIAKKFLLERRVLAKVLENMGYDYTLLDNTDLLKSELESEKYDILFTDEDLLTDTIRQKSENVAIITVPSSKTELENTIKKYRG
jgi:hypothetical protein